ncbi:hypothetical protein SFRURICE_018871 [Spodoptera frugiperda]|nr:hypothetical protein SFRURICE_018871 [Spodoptera frugiperda]
MSMDRWIGKTAVVTGASSGIGSGIAVGFANAGINVIGLARRTEAIEALKSQVTGTGCITGRRCDVSSAEEVAATFKWIGENFGCVHILVNNAGIFVTGGITDAGNDMISEKDIIAILDTNLKGPILCARHAIASMICNKFDGHVININSAGESMTSHVNNLLDLRWRTLRVSSIAGHYVPMSSKFNVYTSSKYGITGFTAGLLNELADHKNKIKVTSVSPGLVNTSLNVVAENASDAMPALRPKDIADACLYILSTPPTVNINELTITPVTERRL